MTSWRYVFSELCNRRGRALLSLFSVVIAVAAIVAVTSATAATRKAFRQVFEALSGRADLEVVSRGGGLFDESVIDRLRKLPDVRDVVPVFRRATVIYASGKKAKVLALGILAEDPESVFGFEIKEGRLPTGAREIAVDASLAAALKTKVGDSARLLLNEGLRPRTIVGTVALGNAVQMHQGGTVLAPLASLQKASHASGDVNALHMYLKDPSRAGAVIAEAGAVLPPELQVEVPSSRNGLAEQTLQLTDVSLFLASALSFTTAVFIALSVFLMNVGERRRQLSILRAIGATRGQVMRMVCSEALLMGIVGTMLGIPVGVFGGRLVTSSMGAVLQITLPVATDVPLAFLIGGIVGPLICLVGAWYPARRASQISPLEGMRPVVTMEPHRGHRMTTLAGALGAVLTCVLMTGAMQGTMPSWVAVVAVVVALVSLVMFLPLALSPAVNLLGYPLRRLLSVEGEMSQRLVLRHSGRSALTIGVLFMAVAAGMALSNAVFSVNSDVQTWHARTMSADFFVRTMMPDLSGQDPTGLPDSVSAQIAAMPGIERAEAIKVLRVDAAGQEGILAARDFGVYDELPLDLVVGEPAAVAAGLRRGEVVVGSVLSERANLHPGDTFEVTAGTSRHALRVAGVVNEYLAGGSIVYMDRRAADELFEFHGIDSFLIKARPGQRAEVGADLQTLADESGVMVQTFSELLTMLDGMTAGVTAGLWVLLALGLLVGALGVVNTLTMNISEQTRELGMLRAIGMARFQIVKTVMGQAAFIGLLGIASGALAGLLLARTINFCLGSLFGHPVAFALRPEFAVLLLILALAVVFLAALVPARRAANLNPIQAMRQD
jgi:putative ABC transport system permease protein